MPSCQAGKYGGNLVLFASHNKVSALCFHQIPASIGKVKLILSFYEKVMVLTDWS